MSGRPDPRPDQGLPVADVDHLVITRFSAVPDAGTPPASRGWLDYRMSFFRHACLPSMAAQSDADYRWLVWFDDRCADAFREEVEDLAAGVFEPIWTHERFFASALRVVRSSATRPWLLTSRLDSDDAVAEDFIAAVHREMRPADRLVIDFPRGLQLDRSGAVYADHLQSNHFVSLLERRTVDGPLTVFGRAHPKLREVADVRRVMAEPMWIEVLHGENLSNAVRGRRVAPDVVARRFTIDLDYRVEVDAETLRREVRARRWELTRERLRNPHAALGAMRAVVDRVRGTRTIPRRTRPTAGEWLSGRRRRLRRVLRRAHGE